ncbi:acyl-CoA ligase (AMP-forming), exosortase A system-associated [Solimicrobium silvestre]|uniref:Acyl-CoA ligase (AMP-forming), exosortase A-associated n=1 Tax=Solimicrobium silvestre TaxID=2099400 RepID=A0A2S9GTB6_9BURK|nr:acyl-CoA ligase (AMP-forming), exosortase A system-associated [Solimicrobium silvestre]PRC90953.1 Acyl-CoA ligase (AMP-forming), exosortase A-associated [Solimicrobium silvestre]
MTDLVHQLILEAAARAPQAEALCYQGQRMSYAELAQQTQQVGQALLTLGVQRSDRVAVYLEKRFETVLAMFGASAAGAAFVPVNPLLKAEQLIYILNDCQVKILVTSAQRLAVVLPLLSECPSLKGVIVVGGDSSTAIASGSHFQLVHWEALEQLHDARTPHCCIDRDIVAILYTSGSTGQPKGVVLSHRNLLAGAQSVAHYLENTADDRVLCVLPLSFDYGLSQLTTVFLTGGTAVLLNYLLPRDILDAVKQERITGLAAVPPLWIQLAALDWSGATSLRYLTNSGGVMQRSTLDILRRNLPDAKIYLMYGLTEAFRSTFLPPEQLDRRPDSIGRAIPNAEVLVLRPDGSECDAEEPGELVHRGALVALGYWNDAEKTAERFKPLPLQLQNSSLPLPEIAVWSGDIVRKDAEGYLYFLGRTDELIKVSGYRVSPTEIEQVICTMDGVSEFAAVGVAHPVLGQAIVAIVKQNSNLTAETLRQQCQRRLPAYMVPMHIVVETEALPRNANGKIDRKALQRRFAHIFNTEFQH